MCSRVHCHYSLPVCCWEERISLHSLPRALVCGVPTSLSSLRAGTTSCSSTVCHCDSTQTRKNGPSRLWPRKPSIHRAHTGSGRHGRCWGVCMCMCVCSMCVCSALPPVASHPRKPSCSLVVSSPSCYAVSGSRLRFTCKAHRSRLPMSVRCSTATVDSAKRKPVSNVCGCV